MEDTKLQAVFVCYYRDFYCGEPKAIFKTKGEANKYCNAEGRYGYAWKKMYVFDRWRPVKIKDGEKL